MTDCAKCGLCCDQIPLSWNPEEVESLLPPVGKRSPTCQEDLEFITKHWHTVKVREDHQFKSAPYHVECDMYDSVNKLCTAHDSRPPVCKGYPWYGEEPSEVWPKKTLFAQCSFQADVHTMLPILEIK